MKVICDRAALVEALNIVTGVIPSRSPKPSLACVKLVAGDGRLSLSTTDLEVAIRMETERVDVTKPGEALIPADKLIQIARESADSTLSIEVANDEAKILGQDSRFTVYGYPVTEFPPIGEDDDTEPAFTINMGMLRILISRTLFATARENSRYAINGVLIHRKGKKLEFVATDGRRLAMARGTCEPGKKAPDETHSIVPTKALQLLLRTPADNDDQVAVSIKDNQITFRLSGETGPRAMLTSHLVEGAFPPYEDVIPKDLDKKITFDVSSLASAVRRAALLTNEESKGVRMAFAEDGLTISSRAPELGEAEIKVPLAKQEGEGLEIGFNPGFIVDALKVLDTPEIVFELKAPNKPGLIRSGPEFTYVLMPVNLS